MMGEGFKPVKNDFFNTVRIGFEVDTVVNGQEAVKKFQREEEKVEYLFILMDCKMPVMDGLKAAEKILSLVTIDIILYTGDERHIHEKKIEELGIRYLKKPASIEDLRLHLVSRI